MHVYITSRNLLSVVDLANQIYAQRGVTGITVIDCGSTFQRLYRRYATLPTSIEIHGADNLGPRAAWALFQPVPPYVVTDGDLCIADWPTDGLLRLKEIALEHPECVKVGAALRIDDLPENKITKQVVAHESQFWQRPLGNDLFSADIDTTLAVYNVNNWGGYGPAIRHGGLQARHLPWYIDPLNPPPDYRHNLTQDDHIPCTHWTDKLRQALPR
jgi:hypothetical protein